MYRKETKNCVEALGASIKKTSSLLKDLRKDHQWKAVKDYEGFYEVSNLGEVKSLAREVPSRGSFRSLSERIMACHAHPLGYITVILCREGKGKSFSVHTLVANAFLPKKPEGHEVDHIDEIKSHNYVSNLRWATRSENSRTSRKHIQKHRDGVFRFKGKSVKYFPSLQAAAKATKIDPSLVSQACRGLYARAGGCTWFYYHEILC